MFHKANFKDSKATQKDFIWPDIWTEEKESDNSIKSQFTGIKGIKIHEVQK